MEESGMGPEVTRYFRKIISSFSVGLLWMLVLSTAGFYFQLALVDGHLRWQNIAFYIFALLSFAGLLYYYYKLWKGLK